MPERENLNTPKNGDPENNDPVKEIENRLIRNLLDFIILKAIKNHKGVGGYDLIIIVNEEFGTDLSSGTIYSILYTIERKGLVKGFFEGRKTGYKITPEGEKALDKIQLSKEELQQFVNTIFTKKTKPNRHKPLPPKIRQK